MLVVELEFVPVVAGKPAAPVLDCLTRVALLVRLAAWLNALLVVVRHALAAPAQ